MKMWNLVVFLLLLMMSIAGGLIIYEFEDHKAIDAEDYFLKFIKTALFVVAPLGLILWGFLG